MLRGRKKSVERDWDSSHFSVLAYACKLCPELSRSMEETVAPTAKQLSSKLAKFDPNFGGL